MSTTLSRLLFALTTAQFDLDEARRALQSAISQGASTSRAFCAMSVCTARVASINAQIDAIGGDVETLFALAGLAANNP